MPITITIEAKTAAEIAALVHDLADTISRMSPAEIPPHTEVSTIDPPVTAPATPVQPTATPDTTSVTTPTAPVAVPQALAAVPVAAPAGAAPAAAPQSSGQAPMVASTTAPVTPPSATPPAPAAVPTAEQSYTLDQLAVAATQLMDAGRQAELRQLLQQFGVQALTALPKEHYGAFATALRQMGAKI